MEWKVHGNEQKRKDMIFLIVVALVATWIVSDLDFDK